MKSSHSHAGTIKSYNPQKGWGFIECEETFSTYGKDIFVMKSGLPKGYAEKGDHVSFSVSNGKSGPEATCTDQSSANGASHHVGTIKSFVAQKGWGLIECEETFREYGKDMFVLRSSLPNQHADRGDRVKFSVVQGEKGPEAADVQFIGQKQHSWGNAHVPSRPQVAMRQAPAPAMAQRWQQAAPKGAYVGSYVQQSWAHAPVQPSWGHAPAQPAWGAHGGQMEPRLLKKGHAGVVKSFNEEKGWGFITPSTAQFGKDLFVMRSALAQGNGLQAGDKVQFKIKMGQKGYEADEVFVVPNVQELVDQSQSGSVKSFNAEKGWGFIESAEVQQMFGKDLLFHKRHLAEGHTPTVGEQVQFSIGENQKGQPEAVNLSFGGGYQPTAKAAHGRAKPY